MNWFYLLLAWLKPAPATAAEPLPTSELSPPINKTRIAGLSAALAAALALGVTQFEGSKPLPYKDIGGVWTACDGDTYDIDPSRIYTPEECKARLQDQLQRHNDRLLACMPLEEAPEHVHAAVLDLGYNIGTGAVCRSSIAAKIKAKDYPAVCASILRFKNAAGRDCSVRANNCYGVYKRRVWDAALCEGRLSTAQIAKGFAGYQGVMP